MPKYLTIAGKKDGFGAQYQALMSGIAYCEYKNYTYIHTPFKTIEHAQCTNSLNEFIGIRSDDRAGEEVPDITETFIPQVHFSANPDLYYTPQVLKKIRKMYYSTAKPGKCKYDIAIHIRRGDITPRTEERYTSNEFYIDLITEFGRKYPSSRICIYSVGQDKDFEGLKLKNVYFCLNEDIEKSFHDLVTAKILVTSKSSFSYSAALLSEGYIYYLPFWHQPLSHWIALSE